MTVTLTKINDCRYVTSNPFRLEINYDGLIWYFQSEYHTEEQIDLEYDNAHATLQDVLEVVEDYIEAWENHI